MWLHRRQVVFQPPPCICDQVESHVREAIAMRDEMARWKTPLEEWLALQVMPVLKLKSEPAPKPKPAIDSQVITYGSTWNGARLSTNTRPKVVRAETGYTHQVVQSFEGGFSSLAILPSDGDVQPGAILKRGNGWYKVLSVGHDRMTVQRYY